MKQLKINTRQLSRYLLVAFLVLVFLAKTVQIELFLYLSLACGAACLCLSDDSTRIGICLLLLPNIRMFDGLQIKFLVNILLVLPVAAYIIEHRRINFIALSHVLMLWTWDMCHALYSNQLDRILRMARKTDLGAGTSACKILFIKPHFYDLLSCASVPRPHRERGTFFY